MGQFEEAMKVIQQNVQSVEAMLRANTVPVDYDVESLTWLEHYLEPQRARLNTAENEKEKNLTVDTIGAYLGECFCRAYAGQWVDFEGDLAIKLPGRWYVFPFSKVAKFINEGSDESFVSHFSVHPVVVERSGSKWSRLFRIGGKK